MIYFLQTLFTLSKNKKLFSHNRAKFVDARVLPKEA
jgi:hypothetical protein